MSNQNFIDRFQLDNAQTLLIQGLPSSVEKHFIKLSYSKNVTPLLKRKKIDFALLFVINNTQLCGILKDVVPALHENSKLWIAFPKTTSKIVSDLNRHCTWNFLTERGFKGEEEFELDHVWMALHFKKENAESTSSEGETLQSIDSEEGMKNCGRTFEKKLSVLPAELSMLFLKHKDAKEFFASLPSINQKEYVTWIQGAKKVETKQRRLEETLEKLLAGKKNPTEE